MPRRRRVDKRRRLGAREVAALRGGTAAVLEHVFGSLDGARAEWESVRSDLIARCPPGERPSGYWVFEGPERLRPLPPGPSGPAVLMALSDDMSRAHDALAVWRAERERLRQERLAWLHENDLLSEREHLAIAEDAGQPASWEVRAERAHQPNTDHEQPLGGPYGQQGHRPSDSRDGRPCA